MVVEQEIRIHDGRYVVLPPFVDAQEGLANTQTPDLSVADTSQQYPLGTTYVDGDRVFKYCAFKGTINPDLGAKDSQPQSVAFTTIAAAALQYATTVVIDVAGTDGIAGDGVIAVDYLAGGYLVVFDASSKMFTRMIKSNTVTSGAGEMTLELTDPIPVALVTDTDHAECMASPYSYLTTSTSEKYAVVGMAQLVYTSGEFGWVQVAGPTWIAPQAAVGSGSNNRICIFRHDGSIDELDYSDAANSKGQIAGYVMQNAQAGGQGAAFIQLQITR
ncbi:hypothetical protein LCGC14_1621380 [marine sediment metagenome]|uniref:Uncharacterized protein n=1 Tax=marine sediment metagenome TaxID=412755 RepID=A0A0F9ISC3_9ZZZZ